MKLPSRLLGAMILTAGLGSLSIGCSNDHPSTPSTVSVEEPVSIDTVQLASPDPDTAEQAVHVNPPDSSHPDHPASFSCPACGKG